MERMKPAHLAPTSGAARNTGMAALTTHGRRVGRDRAVIALAVAMTVEAVHIRPLEVAGMKPVCSVRSARSTCSAYAACPPYAACSAAARLHATSGATLNDSPESWAVFAKILRHQMIRRLPSVPPFEPCGQCSSRSRSRTADQKETQTR